MKNILFMLALVDLLGVLCEGIKYTARKRRSNNIGDDKLCINAFEMISDELDLSPALGLTIILFLSVPFISCPNLFNMHSEE